MIETVKVTEHYTQDDLVDRIRTALRSAGLEKGQLTAAQLGALDQFHLRGLAATIELAEALAPPANAKVLDIGSGLGGPSRYLAATYACDVTGIDLSASFVEAASFLAERTGLSHMVRYQCADALALPFENSQFDVVWTQHVTMNIMERARFYSEASRVLRTRGKLGVYDVVSVGSDDLAFPVPWARNADTNYLTSGSQMRSTMEQQGFRVVSWIDRTQEGLDCFKDVEKLQTASAGKPPALGLHVAMGPDFKEMFGNFALNMRSGRIGLVEAVVEKI